MGLTMRLLCCLYVTKPVFFYHCMGVYVIALGRTIVMTSSHGATFTSYNFTIRYT